MLEEIEAFKANLLNSNECVGFMEAVATFADETALEFEREFPQLHPKLYQNTKIWHSLIGSTLPAGFEENTISEVYEWFEARVRNFLDTYFDNQAKAVA